jgi:hypothetical protein
MTTGSNLLAFLSSNRTTFDTQWCHGAAVPR